MLLELLRLAELLSVPVVRLLPDAVETRHQMLVAGSLRAVARHRTPVVGSLRATEGALRVPVVLPVP